MRRRLYRSSRNSLQHLITTSAALAELAAHVTATDVIALDTEFLRERTYRAVLALVQIATSQSAVCIDPLGLADLTPLTSSLTAPRPIKVMHAARQDIEVLFPAVGHVQ